MRQEKYELSQHQNGREMQPDYLTNQEEDISEVKKKEDKIKAVGYVELFRFANCTDILLMIIGTLVAMLHGTAYPAMVYIFGDSMDLFVKTAKYEQFFKSELVTDIFSDMNLTISDIVKNPDIFKEQCLSLKNYTLGNVTCDPSQFQLDNQILHQMFNYTIYYTIIGSSVILLGYLQIAVWMTSAERQIYRIRLRFYKNVLRQDMKWFDTSDIGELNSRLSDDIRRIHDGLGDKIGSSIQWISAFIAGCTIGFINGWKLTLVILSISPLLILASALMSKLAASITNKELEAYAKAGSIAEEVLSSIRTVAAFGGQKIEAKRYSDNLHEAKKFGIRKSMTNGLCLGFLSFVIMATYSLGFWYGTKLTIEESDNYTVGRMMIVFYAVFVGSFSLGNASPGIQALSTARAAAYTIYKLIDQNPDIDVYSDEGLKLASVKGHIEFQNVQFSYPSRADVKVLRGLCLDIRPGQTAALVGSSGCGKSTVVQLLQRFYSATAGTILVDGNSIDSLNVKWLRNIIGIVSQEPDLFDTTIKENISFGLDGVSDKDIEDAAKMANAHEFISALPQKYETMVGERGAQLSGGQKQRIAIARALVRNPKILILDEATSALDTESERIVQEALDKARQGRTTIVIAHRLSTIKTADVIFGIDGGQVVEHGTHQELLQTKGIYYNLVMSQTIRTSEDEQSEDSDPEIVEEIEEFIRTESLRRSGKLHRRSSRKSITSNKSVGSVVPAQSLLREKERSTGGLFRMLQMNSPEWYFIVIGCLAAILNGCVQPAFAVLFSEVLKIFGLSEDQREKEIFILSMILLGIGFVSWLATFIQSYMFGKSGEKLTLRLRQETFAAMLRQEMSWFDDERNNTGSLTTKLATEASSIQGATGVRLGMAFQNLSSMGIALVLAYVYGWKLSLLITAFLPFIIIAGAVQIKILAGVAGNNKTALECAGKIAVESFDNIRTITSLSLQAKFHQQFTSQLQIPYKDALKKSHLAGAAFGLSQAVVFYAYAASFYFGAYLVQQNEMDYVAVFRVFVAIVYGAYALGQASAFAPDASKAKAASVDICRLLDRKPTINIDNDAGHELEEFTGQIEFRNVKFRYPTRPDVAVLQGLDLRVKAGESLALVGTSGCGKSTSIQLLQRFYEPISGTLIIGDHDIKELNIQWFRSQIGLVSQEPVLFDKTIKDNIAYGDNSREVSMSEIISVARMANIHSFICSLPQGYETKVGEKGAQLSGGQKQRVAIARALLRNPKVLLLDEATSALDTESEKIVQDALDGAREGRTSIIIAHRLSTIQNVDKIGVIRNGRVVELGTHNELMKQGRFYYKLNQVQNKMQES